MSSVLPPIVEGQGKVTHRARVVLITSLEEAQRELQAVGVAREGRRIMAPKAISYLVKLEGIGMGAANVLKQEMLARGGEVAISAKAYYLLGEGQTDVLIMGTLAQYQRLYEKLLIQPFGLPQLGREIMEVLRRLQEGPPPLVIGGHRFDFSSRSYITGIINVTPDSFYDGGKYFTTQGAVEHGLRLAEEGADILEVGGEAAGPGLPNTPQEEISRVVPVIEGLVKRVAVPISVDTGKYEVAKAAVEAGAAIINDILSLRDPRLAELAAQCGAGLVLMHFLGQPREAPKRPSYRSLMEEICGFLEERARRALAAGVPRERIVVDPGIGFSKNAQDDLEVMRRLPELKSLGYPIMIGTSHRGFIGEALGLPVGERLEATAATVAYAIAQGANIVRVHEVKYMRRVALMMAAMMKGHPVASGEESHGPG